MTRDRNGFAVVLMVALLAAIVLLLVGLAALTRGELRRTAQNEAAARARANAMVGLRVALGRLQEAAGPDVCSTAQARFGGAVANPFWTGVWRDAGEPVWLVSGEPTDADRAIVTSGALADGAILVGENTAGSGGGCAAPWEAITTADWPGCAGDTETGRFAFWVGDEGVKGNVVVGDHVDEVPVPVWPGPDDPVRDAGSRARLRQLVVHRTGADALNFGDPPTSGFLLGAENDADSAARWAALGRVLTPAQLRFVAPSAGAPQYRAFLPGRYHDLSVCSLGLLVDAAHGGLRANLSALASTDVPAAVRDLERYRPESGRLPVWAGNAAAGETTFQIKPIVTEWELVLVPYREDGGERLLVGARLRLELWNPYALPLAQTPAGEADYRVRVGGLPAIRVTGPAGNVGEVALDSALGPDAEFWVDVPGDIGGGEVLVVETVVGQAWDTGLAVTDPTPDDPGDDVLRIETVPDADRRLRLSLRTLADEPLTTHIGFPSEDFARECAPGAWSVTGNRPFPGDDAVVLLGVGYHWQLDPARTTWADWVDPEAPLDAVPDLRDAVHDFAAGSWRTPSGDPAERARRCGSAFAGGELFSAGFGGIGHDFPVQRNLSVAALGQLSVPGARAFSVGNPWGGERNEVFDRFLFNPVSAAWSAGERLPVVRYRVIEPVGATPPDASALGGRHAARFLGAEGMFNVNSVSADAWTVILGRAVTGWRDGAGEVRDLENPFFVLPHSAQHLTGAERGMRTFSDGKVQNLATAIAARIRGRPRPFRSLAEFVNSGVVEAAIADVGLNTTAAGWADLGAAPPRWSPGWLTQAAVLSGLAPVLSVRSDTFTIRVAAEALNPVLPADDPERVAARAWCEAVVQRQPEFCDVAEAPESWPASDPLNAKLGRRFRIVSFRWLGPDDL